MSILTRLARLIKADSHHLINQVELPDVMLKQAIREMQASLDQVRQTLQRIQTERQSSEEQQVRFANEVAQISEQLNLCFEANNLELARSLIRRRLQTQAHLEQLKHTQSQREKEHTRLAQQENDYSRELASIKTRAAGFTPHDKAIATRSGTGVASRVTEDEVEIALLTEIKRRGAHYEN